MLVFLGTDQHSPIVACIWYSNDPKNACRHRPLYSTLVFFRLSFSYLTNQFRLPNLVELSLHFLIVACISYSNGRNSYPTVRLQHQHSAIVACIWYSNDPKPACRRRLLSICWFFLGLISTLPSLLAFVTATTLKMLVTTVHSTLVFFFVYYSHIWQINLDFRTSSNSPSTFSSLLLFDTATAVTLTPPFVFSFSTLPTLLVFDTATTLNPLVAAVHSLYVGFFFVYHSHIWQLNLDFRTYLRPLTSPVVACIWYSNDPRPDYERRYLAQLSTPSLSFLTLYGLIQWTILYIWPCSSELIR